jgi:hypothetical protein
MGTAEIQGELWDKMPQDWATFQEPMHKPLWEAMLEVSGRRVWRWWGQCVSSRTGGTGQWARCG